MAVITGAVNPLQIRTTIIPETPLTQIPQAKLAAGAVGTAGVAEVVAVAAEHQGEDKRRRQ
jgi:hypothetical protein